MSLLERFKSAASRAKSRAASDASKGREILQEQVEEANIREAAKRAAEAQDQEKADTFKRAERAGHARAPLDADLDPAPGGRGMEFLATGEATDDSMEALVMGSASDESGESAYDTWFSSGDSEKDDDSESWFGSGDGDDDPFGLTWGDE